MTGEHCSVITIPLQCQNSHVERAHHNSDHLYCIWQLSFTSSPCVIIFRCRVPYLQLLPAGRECILWAFQCKGWWMGLPVLPGCSGSASSSSCTLSSGWACCSAHQMHTRGLSPTPPGMWISVRSANTRKWAWFSSCITRTDSPVRAIYNRKERKGVGGVQWNQTLSVTQARAHTKWTNRSFRAYSGTNSKQLNPYKLGEWPTQLHILMLSYRQWKVCLQHQLSYVNSLSGVQWGPLIKPEQQITFYHSLSHSLVLQFN